MLMAVKKSKRQSRPGPVAPEPAGQSGPPPSFAELLGDVRGARSESASEADSFKPRMGEVTPLRPAKERIPPPDPPAVGSVRVSLGPGVFNVTDDPQSFEARAGGVNQALVRQLKQGRYPPEASLDVHGMTAAKAERVVLRFLSDSVQRKRRTILIVHGRGVHSGPEGPVLRALVAKLLMEQAGAFVLALCAAPARWGGDGATLARLRKTPDMR